MWEMYAYTGCNALCRARQVLGLFQGFITSLVMKKGLEIEKNKIMITFLVTSKLTNPLIFRFWCNVNVGKKGRIKPTKAFYLAFREVFKP